MPGCFDCSGPTTAAYATVGITLPRTAHTQYFATERVGMYFGNGLMVNAPTFGMPVQVATLAAGGNDLSGAGRPA